MAGLGQGMGNERRTREAGLDVVATLGHQLVKPVSATFSSSGSSSSKTMASAYVVSASLVDVAFRPDVVVVERGSGSSAG